MWVLLVDDRDKSEVEEADHILVGYNEQELGPHSI